MQTIIICEPQCAGFEHVEFNAAFLVRLIKTYPQHHLIFFGEEGHLNFIREKLRYYQHLITYEPITISPRYYNSFSRIKHDCKVVNHIINYANKQKHEDILFTSITTPALYALKYQLILNNKLRCGIILHGILETIQKIPLSKPWKIPFWFKYCLSLSYLANLKYIILGDSLKQNLVKILPKIETSLITIDMPYFLREPYKNNLASDVLRFSSIGVANKSKGSHIFIEIAQTCAKIKFLKKPQFNIIGFTNDSDIKRLLSEAGDAVAIASEDVPLERDKFEDMLVNTDYVVFCYPSNVYKLTASAALLDAISHLKPIIAIENDFFCSYFTQMGDIGYLCKDAAEVLQVIQQILNSENLERYHKQRSNLLEKRIMFSCEKEDPQLYNLFK